MSENGEIYTAGKNFTLPPAVTGWTNSTSVGNVESVLPMVTASQQKRKKKLDKCIQTQ